MSSWADFSSKVKAAKGGGKRKEKGLRGDGDDGVLDARNGNDSSRESESKADLTSTSQSGEASKRKRREAEEDWDDVLGKKNKRLPAFLRPSPNVSSRSSKHDAHVTSTWNGSSSAQLDDVRSALERKAKMYDQLQRGKTAGWNEERIQDSLVDWDRKEAERTEDDDDDGDFSSHASNEEAEHDPLVEYEDEFGRTRWRKRSEVPRAALRDERKREEEEIDESLITYGEQTSFPVYRPDPARPASSNELSSGGYKRTASSHFDASSDRRFRGAAFYQFSQNEEERRRQMDDLRRARDDTEKVRSEGKQADDSVP